MSYYDLGHLSTFPVTQKNPLTETSNEDSLNMIPKWMRSIQDRKAAPKGWGVWLSQSPNHYDLAQRASFITPSNKKPHPAKRDGVVY